MSDDSTCLNVRHFGLGSNKNNCLKQFLCLKMRKVGKLDNILTIAKRMKVDAATLMMIASR